MIKEKLKLKINLSFLLRFSCFFNNIDNLMFLIIKYKNIDDIFIKITVY